MIMNPAQASSGVTVGLLDRLLQNGAISSSQYDAVKLASLNTGESAEILLLGQPGVKPGDVARAKGELNNIPFVELDREAASPEALTVLPESVVKRYAVMPVSLDKDQHILTVAMENPLDMATIEFLEKKSGYHVKPVIAASADIRRAIDERFQQSLSSEVTAVLRETSELGAVRTVPVPTEGRQIIQEAPITKIVDTILEFATKARASDVHIEPQERESRVRYRIDGMLQEKLVLPRRLHDAVVSRIKIMSEMKIDEKRVPQDGRFDFKLGNIDVDLRVSSLPTVHGEKVVMRLLKKSGAVPDLSGLGLRGRALKNLEDAIRIPHGIILITGPTGSGKTTTLYSILTKVNQPTVNIITLEDPVEYQIPGVNQVQVNPQAGLTFASGLRSFLRQDPNIIMVGEVRDTETAELAIQAALTGHLVFSTLHTNSAAGALPRLLDMQAEPFLIVSTITCVVAQRVVRKICDHCHEAYQPPEEVVSDIRAVLGSLTPEQPFQLFRGKGCAECGDKGYLGRIAIFEVLPMTEKIGRLVLEHKPASAVETQAVADGMLLMKQDGYLKALTGITTIEEVLRVAQI